MAFKVSSLLLVSIALVFVPGGFASDLNPDVALDHNTATLASASGGRKMLGTAITNGATLRSLQEEGGAAGEFDADCWTYVGDYTPCGVGTAPYCCDSQNPTKASACQGPADNTITCTDQYGAAYVYGWCKNNIC